MPENKSTAEKSLRLAISCGGTGGHFHPGLSIARKIKEDGGEVLLLLSGKHAAKQSETAGSFGISSVNTPSSGRPSNPLGLPIFFKNTIAGIIGSRKEMKNFRPDAFLGMGSFASVPQVLAAKSMGIPVFLHEGNARIGKANRILSRFARHMALSFEAVNPESCRCPSSCTGMPLRPELTQLKMKRSQAVRELNAKYASELRADIPTLLVFGGSQGAEIFNKTVPQALIGEKNMQFQVIHLTGHGKLEACRELYGKTSFELLLLESSPDMGLFFSCSDIALCRSGGSSIAELSLFGVPALLVPYPYAAEKHQDDNAEICRKAGAAQIIRNGEFTEERFSAFIGDWLEDPEKYREAGKKMASIAKASATEDIVKLISEYFLNP